MSGIDTVGFGDGTAGYMVGLCNLPEGVRRLRVVYLEIGAFSACMVFIGAVYGDGVENCDFVFLQDA